jgi:hypothetical protein
MAKKGQGKRDLVRRSTASSYAKRTARGRFKDMDDVGRSQAADKPRKAKRTVGSGYAIKVTGDGPGGEHVRRGPRRPKGGNEEPWQNTDNLHRRP